MIKYIVPIFISFLVSCINIPIILKISQSKKLYDTVDARKIHSGNISRLGGVAFILGFSCALIIAMLFSNTFARIKQNVFMLVIAAIIISTFGIIDDVKNLKPKVKFFFQCVAAIIVLAADFKFTKITLGTFDFSLNLGYFSYPITFIWIIGITNAFNFIDGIDGQAGMLAVLISSTFAIFFLKYNNLPAVLVCLSLTASVIGFLIFNLPLPKAKIFMGDGGSQFLGFILSVLPLLSDSEGSATIALPYASAILIIPIFDTIAAIWRRLREGRRIDSPDKFHIHHKLMLMGFSSHTTLVLVSTFQFTICLFMISAMWIGGVIALLLLIAVYIACTLFFTIIHIQKQAILNAKTENDS